MRRHTRVVLAIGSARPGGAEGQLVRLACELRQRDLDVRVLFLFAGGSLTQRLDAGGVPWQMLARRAPTSHLRALAPIGRLALRLATWQPDLVVAWLPAGVRATLPLAAVLTRAKRVAGFRGGVFGQRGLSAVLLRHAVAHAHAVTVNALALRGEALAWGARAERLVYIPNGVDIPETPACVDRQPPTAVVVANFRWYKGHDVLVDALALVDEPLMVRLLGEGDRRPAIRAQARRAGVAHRVQFVEHPADVAAELRAAQFAIHPSHTEGMSNAVLEELAAGLPVVATDVGATSVLVEDGVNGFLVPAGDEQLLAKRVSEMASSAQLRGYLAAAARARAQEFSWSACTAQYLALVQRLTRQRLTRPHRRGRP